MHTDTPAPVRLRDYTPPAYLVNAVHLDVDICAPGTWVVATMNCVRNPAVPGEYPLVLDGEELETHSVKVDGRLLPADAYQLSEHRLVVNGLPERFTLETRVSIQPDKNTQLSGLYRSRDGYFTQCEPQGFRRITWFIDRPDVMARYTVTINPPTKSSRADLIPEISIGEDTYHHKITTVDYDHLPYLSVVSDATVHLQSMDIKTTPRTIAYITGAGDDVPASLAQIGYTVDVIDIESLSVSSLAKYQFAVLRRRAITPVYT